LVYTCHQYSDENQSAAHFPANGSHLEFTLNCLTVTDCLLPGNGIFSIVIIRKNAGGEHRISTMPYL